MPKSGRRATGLPGVDDQCRRTAGPGDHLDGLLNRWLPGDVPVDDEQDAVRDKSNPSNEAFDTLKAQFKQSLAEHWEEVASGEEKIYKEYMKELSVREFHYQTQGSLDGVLAIRAEKDHLEETGTLLNSETELKHLAIVRRNFAQDLRKLKSADRERLLGIYRDYLDDLGELERSLVRKDRIDEAIVVRKERKRAAEDIRNRAQQDLVLSVYEVSQNE